MANKIDIEQWLEENENELIDGNNTDSNDESQEDQVVVNNENTDTENSDYDCKSESNSDNFGPILQNKYFYCEE